MGHGINQRCLCMVLISTYFHRYINFDQCLFRSENNRTYKRTPRVILGKYFTVSANQTRMVIHSVGISSRFTVDVIFCPDRNRSSLGWKDVQMRYGWITGTCRSYIVGSFSRTTNIIRCLLSSSCVNAVPVTRHRSKQKQGIDTLPGVVDFVHLFVVQERLCRLLPGNRKRWATIIGRELCVS